MSEPMDNEALLNMNLIEFLTWCEQNQQDPTTLLQQLTDTDN